MQQLDLLVIPGSTSYRSVLESQLDAARYRLDFATDLQTAFARSPGAMPDLVLLDADLDEPRWFEYRARLHADEHTARLPVLVLMHAEQLAPNLPLDASDDMVVVPWSAAELQARIARGVHRTRAGETPPHGSAVHHRDRSRTPHTAIGPGVDVR